MEEVRTEADAALEAGKQIATLAQEVKGLANGGAPFVLGADGQPISLEALLPRPLRIKQTLSFPEVASFVGYVQAYGETGPDSAERTALFADHEACSVTAILDYHGAQPAHLSHRATLTLKKSEEWQAWTARHNQGLGQDALAEFLEERVLDIREPESAAVLDAVKNLKLSRNGRYDRTTDLTTGSVQFHYVDEVQNKGTYTLPSLLVLGLRVFEHGEHYGVPVQLRYRLREDKLTFFFKLQRPDLIQRDAFQQILRTVEEGTGIKPLIGTVR